ncbi:MAG: hypothetical protein Q9P01_20760 [Anaerolineae bacterium]|nr:hypothetical protein [Anaerolineae bacterium]MDQ7037180.1 hypothetical protein [Anaerolineae bacterium]
MSQDPINYDEIQRRVRDRVQRRYRFYAHSLVFVLGIAVVGSLGSPVLFLIWVGAWVGHWLYNNYLNNLEQAIEQEVEAEINKVVKRKRDYADIYDRYDNGDFDYDEDEHPSWLGDDGELIGYED